MQYSLHILLLLAGNEDQIQDVPVFVIQESKNRTESSNLLDIKVRQNSFLAYFRPSFFDLLPHIVDVYGQLALR